MRRKAFNTATSVLLLETSAAPSNPQGLYSCTDPIDRNIGARSCIGIIIYGGGGGGCVGGGGNM